MMKQKRNSLAAFLIATVVLAGCGNTVPTSIMKNTEATTATNVSGTTSEAGAKSTLVTPEEAKKMLDADSTIVLLDVREPDEYKTIHIPGSTLLPLGDVKTKVAEIIPDKNTTIIVYCHSGRRSALAATDLVGLGYTKVYDVGGIQNWPYATESGTAAP
jgi:phage shock protein E